MTAAEMKYAVLLQMDSIFEGASPGYNDLQISVLLSKAQRRVFNEKKKLYDTDETVKRMLSPLNRRASLDAGTIVAVSAGINANAHPNGTYYRLPSDVAYITEEFVKLTINQADTPPVLVKPITYDYYTKNYNNSYKKPYVGLVWRLDYRTDTVAQPAAVHYTVELITDGSTIGDYQISYIKVPADIVVGGSPVNCEILDVNFQDEIISETVKMMTAALNDEGYQVAMNETTFDK